jgi:hypothetical protein
VFINFKSGNCEVCEPINKYIPNAIIGIRPIYFMMDPNIIEQIAFTTPDKKKENIYL